MQLSKIIKENALAYHVAFIDVATINKIGIGKATFLGMEEVAKKLFKKVTNPYLLIDALEIPNSKIPQRGIIRGDSLSISIAAASIIAKVARDKLMDELSFKFFQYGLEKNKGYGTKFHRISIGKHGVTELHRTDFCRKYI